ncbi:MULTISPECIES: helix-turn-helix domain-containing protein [unclassified Enterococcus]|uniref:helix-turn-helix domain-containing protein n=1 Tax=unclassified Enterococcus TaxID=2608891 RepID=UPI001CE1424E|nr:MULTISPECIES: Rgg/GadR/MutR family transcriptional regulator [unclassified Enterococcus]MCA5014014.1 helix-turn-helix domain-containing protein [Enterococcus sp. S23]MCA5017212.1 helix-turn-helix domain-containing protein [Enterococcus sp. S22(2020)]
MNNYGSLIKKIRIEKGLSQKNVYSGIMTRQTYYLIESNVSMPSFDKFLLILEKLFLSVEEFLNLLDPEYFPAENQLYYELSHAVFKKDKAYLETLKQLADQRYQTTKNEKYYHLFLITQAMLQINFTNEETPQNPSLQQLMSPIKNYLIGVDKWYLYELKLLNNSLYCFSPSEAIALGTLVTDKIDPLNQIETLQDTKLRIYLNLSSLCLNYKDYQHAMDFSKLAIANAQSDYRLFEMLIARLNHAIAHSADTSKQLTPEITKYLDILETLDYCKIVEDYQSILQSNQIN